MPFCIYAFVGRGRQVCIPRDGIQAVHNIFVRILVIHLAVCTEKGLRIYHHVAGYQSEIKGKKHRNGEYIACFKVGQRI